MPTAGFLCHKLGQITTTVYDAASQTIATILPLGQRTTYSYDSVGQEISVQNANGQLATTVYNAVGESIATVNALGYRTTSVYDELGRNIAVVDARANRLTMQYDAVGNKTVEIDPLQRRTTFAYDSAQRQTSRLDARGNKTTYTYEPNGWQQSRRYPDSTAITWIYDPVGNLVNIISPLGNHERTFDPLDRTINFTNPDDRTLTFTWDAVSQRKSLADPDGGLTTYTYDAAGRLKQLVNPQSGITTYQYDATGQEIGKQLANETITTTTYDDNGWLTKVVNATSTGTTITAFEYAYDHIGNKTSQTNADNEITTWIYDAASQLLSENLQDKITTFTYDDVGNRLTQETTDEITTSTYDAANQLISSENNAGITTYTYDNNGNQQSLETPSNDLTTYIWDYENRLSLMELPDETLITYVYDPVNQQDEYLVQKETEEGTTHYFYDNNNILQEYDTTTQSQYTYQPEAYGNLISQHHDLESNYYHYDGNFSTSALTDNTQTETDTYNYTAWGEKLTNTGNTENPFTWKGEIGYYQDEDGLQLLRNRRYSSQQGRFISEDPIGLESGESNFYSYVANNPINSVDPEGLKDCKEKLSCLDYDKRIAHKKKELEKAYNGRKYLKNGRKNTGDIDKRIEKLEKELQEYLDCKDLNCPPLPSPPTVPGNPTRSNPSPNFPTLPTPYAPPQIPSGPSSGGTCSSGGTAQVTKSMGFSQSQFPDESTACTLETPPSSQPLKCSNCEDGLRTTPLGGNSNLCMVIVNEFLGVGELPVRIIFNPNSDTERDLACSLGQQLKAKKNLGDVKKAIETGAVVVKEGVAIVSGVDNIELVLEASSLITGSEKMPAGPTNPIVLVGAVVWIVLGGRLKKARKRTDGSFSITDWTGYPDGAPKPKGPFRLLTGTEYKTAREAADRANAALRRSNPTKYAGKEIHEIHPVKFGGSPTDPANKIALIPDVHTNFTVWWNKFQNCIQE